jgi:hypothetical protein
MSKGQIKKSEMPAGQIRMSDAIGLGQKEASTIPGEQASMTCQNKY